MRKFLALSSEAKTTVVLFFLAFLFATTGILVKTIDKKNIPLTPFSKHQNIFSYLKTYTKPQSTVYGYLPYWSLERLEFLQLDKLTDIAYFGIYIQADGNFKKFITNGDGDTITEPGYNNWVNNNKINELIAECKKHDVRFALTIIAHYDEENDAFLDCRTCWDTLLTEVKEELDAKNIKDVNLNFEYAEYTEPEYAQKFAELTKFFNESLDSTYGDSKVVVSAFADSPNKNRVSSNVTDLAKYSDGIFIMAYDFHRPTSNNAGPVAPIDGAGVHAQYDIRTMVRDYLTLAPPNKLILGVPYYGYNWVIDENYIDPENEEISEKYAKRKEGSDEVGYSMPQSYESVMNTIIEANPTVLWDELSLSPYFKYISPETGSLREVYFENKESLRYKYRLAKDNRLSGVGIWALGYDGGYTELWDLIFEEFIY